MVSAIMYDTASSPATLIDFDMKSGATATNIFKVATDLTIPQPAASSSQLRIHQLLAMHLYSVSVNEFRSKALFDRLWFNMLPIDADLRDVARIVIDLDQGIDLRMKPATWLRTSTYSATNVDWRPYLQTSIDVLPASEINSYEDFRKRLYESLKLNPIDDGYIHPFEEILSRSFRRSHDKTIEWIERTLHDMQGDQPTLDASVLQIVGRLPRSLPGIWGVRFAEQALSDRRASMREAGVLALENWGGSDSVTLLSNYVDTETLPWLRRYTTQVIRDLSE